MTADTVTKTGLTTEDDDNADLTPEQRQRAAALAIARSVLSVRAGVFSSQMGASFTVADLLGVAEWVLDTAGEEGAAERALKTPDDRRLARAYAHGHACARRHPVPTSEDWAAAHAWWLEGADR